MRMNTDKAMTIHVGARGSVIAAAAHPVMDSSVFIRIYPCSSVFQRFSATTGTKGKSKWT
jgi:hypothetical protein